MIEQLVMKCHTTLEEHLSIAYINNIREGNLFITLFSKIVLCSLKFQHLSWHVIT